MMRQLSVVIVNKVLNNQLHDPIGCRTYLGESSIPSSGFGMYSAVNISEGDNIGYDDAFVILIDFPLHNVYRDKENAKKYYNLAQYVWTDGLGFGISNEAHQVSASLAGMGSVANCAPGVKHSDVKLSQLVGYKAPRFSEVEAGASNEFGVMRWKASKNIQQGMELFANYGDSYFKREDRRLDTVPLADDFKYADMISSEFFNSISSPQNKNLSQEVKQKKWRKTINGLPKKVQAALPSNITYLENVVNDGSALFALLPDVIRTPEWLEKHGLCMDNIIPRPSKLQYGGIGAFSSRFLTKNSLIAPIPLMIMERSHLIMYEQKLIDFKLPEFKNKVMTHQLLLNYCFGHRDSSLLFLPYSSNVLFINHSSQKTNAKLRWSKHKLHKSTWLDLPPKELLKKSSGLIIELIATQDINVGDEIYLDYGKDWEEAWNTHLSKWKQSPQKQKGTIKMVENYDNYYAEDDVVPTILEQKILSYPKNIQTACVLNNSLERHKNGKTKLKFFWGGSEDNASLFPCDILERNLSNTKFVARFWPFVVHNIPRSAVKFISRVYSSNQSNKNAFRHSISIPDDMIPSRWKDSL